MIIVYHQNNKVVEVGFEGKNIPFSPKSVAFNLFEIAEIFPEQLIIWCRLDLKSNLNIAKVEEIFHHKKIAASYRLSAVPFLSKTIGYVDESLFLNVKKDIIYPTWQMSGDIGGMYAEVLNALKKHVKKDSNFDYFLHSLAKLAMTGALLCYSEPLLLQDTPKIRKSNAKNNFLTFRFVKQHYKTRWVFLLFLNLLIYEKKFPFLPFLLSFGFRKRKLNANSLDAIKVQSSRKVIDKNTIDVIIPTIGRKNYLYDVLKDLSKQTHLPENVIVIEQNPNLNTTSELDYISYESWPFTIKHTLTHQAGACNARNLALAEVTSEWVFLADDDIRIDKDFNFKILETINRTGSEAVSISCIQKEERPRFKTIFQWGNFGSGCSFLKREILKECKFNMGYEFGYGEDNDFGMQLRNQGIDVLYIPDPKIVHLKASMGGFRTKPVLQWQNETIQPKPSPTVMLYQLLHQTQEQRLGYKTTLFFKFYSKQTIKNPLKYFISFRKQWNKSVFWATKLKKQS